MSNHTTKYQKILGSYFLYITTMFARGTWYSCFLSFCTQCAQLFMNALAWGHRRKHVHTSAHTHVHTHKSTYQFIHIWVRVRPHKQMHAHLGKHTQCTLHTNTHTTLSSLSLGNRSNIFIYRTEIWVLYHWALYISHSLYVLLEPHILLNGWAQRRESF